MLRLILMRHAKSSWGNPALDDHDRPLNGRGRRSAVALGNWLREGGYLPDEALSSTARRTRETLAGLKLDMPVRFEPGLYLASPNEMLEGLGTARGRTVLLLGHNPGCAEFAEGIVNARPDHLRFLDFPTGATLVLDLPVDDWAEVDWGTGTPVDFAIPRELTEGGKPT